jgi:predicted nucleic acid-binding protein
MATIEISAIRDEVRRRRVLLLLPEHIIGLSADVFGRARALVSDGFQAADAVHVAAAEALKVDVFLTCDDRLQKLCSRISGRLRVTVDNPLSWIKERENATDS